MMMKQIADLAWPTGVTAQCLVYRVLNPLQPSPGARKHCSMTFRLVSEWASLGENLFYGCSLLVAPLRWLTLVRSVAVRRRVVVQRLQVLVFAVKGLVLVP